MNIEASFPTYTEPAELVQQSENLLNDVARLAENFDTRVPRLGMIRLVPLSRQA